MEEPDYEIVASTENTPYLLWQALLFHASCVQTQGVAPSIVVHGDGPLLPGFRALAELGARVIPAPSYRMSDGVEYTCRNTAGTLVEVEHERPWTLICDPDFLFLEPLPKKAQAMCDGCAVSWDFVSYMQVGDSNRRWLMDGCVERGANPGCVDKVKAGGVVPNFVRRDIHRDFAPRWIAAVDSLVKLAQANGEVPWVTIAWAFGLAAWEMELELALTRLTDTTHGGATAPESSLEVPILHYCYGDQSFDKRRHRAADSAAAVWTLDASGASVLAGFVRRLHVARDWFRERALDVTDQHLYENGKSDAPRTAKAEAAPRVESPTSADTCYLDSQPLAEVSVGYGSLGLHGSLGYEDKLVAVQGKGFEHALSTHAPARLVFRLGGRTGRFRAHVALNDDVPAGATNASFSVFADGRLIAVAPHVDPGVSHLLEANVNGAEELELRVETTRFEHCHAVWLDPELEVAGDAVAAPQTLVDCLGRTEISLPARPLRAKRCIATVASAGFAEMLDDLLGSIRGYANCPDALLVVFNIDGDGECDRIAEKHGAATVHCARRGPKNSTLKSLMYSAARVIDAEQFLCLDADMLVVGDLSSIFGTLEACTAGSLLACREGNSRYHRDVEHVLTTTYYGNPADLERIQGVKTDDGSYPLVVNDGLFAGDRDALMALDGVIRSWHGAPGWVDELWHNNWRNQFIFNLAMAHLRSGIELDSGYNVQLYWHDVELSEVEGRVRATFCGRPVRVLHFNGTSRNKYPEWRPRIARGGLRELREPRGFMTVCCTGNYVEVFSEILESLLESRLYEKSRSIELAVLGDRAAQRTVERMIAPFERFHVAHRSSDLGECEYPALELLHKACRDANGPVYYLHTKGVSHPRTDPYQRYWRTLMLYHVVDRHEECLAALDTHACAGTGWKGDHYSGNFWWAKAEHIRSLPDLADLRKAPRRVAWDPANDFRYQCEYWIGMSEGPFKSIGPEFLHFHENIRYTHTAAEIVSEVLDASEGKDCLKLASTDTGIEQAPAETKYDVIFVDAEHAGRCLERMEWALERLTQHGALVVHGSNPPTAGDSNDEIWKAVVRFRTKYPELGVATVDTDHGCTIVRPHQLPKERFVAPHPSELTWKRFDENRAAWLNLISVRRFRRDLVHLRYAVGRAELRTRTDVLNGLASRFGLERYLEIGIGDPKDNFERIVAPVRQSVDPTASATFRMPSDEFFASRLGCETYDLVFIDGLHEADQCLRDIENSLRRLSPNGFVVLHDSNPPTEWHQRPVEQFEPGSEWNGTVWKAVVRLRERHPECAVFTVDVDWGCTVIRASGGEPVPLSPVPESELGWAAFEHKRAKWLNLISLNEFRAFLLR